MVWEANNSYERHGLNFLFEALFLKMVVSLWIEFSFGQLTAVKEHGWCDHIKMLAIIWAAILHQLAITRLKRFGKWRLEHFFTWAAELIIGESARLMVDNILRSVGMRFFISNGKYHFSWLILRNMTQFGNFFEKIHFKFQYLPIKMLDCFDDLIFEWLIEIKN